MKIRFSPHSPYVRKCLVVAHELGLIDQVQLLPSNAHPVQRDRELIGDNPLGKVPTFYTDDGRVLYDSRVICEYLNDLARGALIPADRPERWQVLTLQALADGMLDALLLARYETVARPPALFWADWLDAQLDKVRTSLAALEGRVGEWAGRVDLGMLALACALWYLDHRFADFDWRRGYPRVAQWYAAFSQRPSLAAQWQLAAD